VQSIRKLPPIRSGVYQGVIFPFRFRYGIFGLFPIAGFFNYNAFTLYAADKVAEGSIEALEKTISKLRAKYKEATTDKERAELLAKIKEQELYALRRNRPYMFPSSIHTLSE